MKKGMIFDLFQEGQSLKRVMVINSTDVVDLETLEVIKNINFDDDVLSILIDNVFEYGV